MLHLVLQMPRPGRRILNLIQLIPHPMQLIQPQLQILHLIRMIQSNLRTLHPVIQESILRIPHFKARMLRPIRRMLRPALQMQHRIRETMRQRQGKLLLIPRILHTMLQKPQPTAENLHTPPQNLQITRILPPAIPVLLLKMASGLNMACRLLKAHFQRHKPRLQGGQLLVGKLPAPVIR